MIHTNQQQSPASPSPTNCTLPRRRVDPAESPARPLTARAITRSIATCPGACFGDDLVDQLGSQSIDPAEALACPEIQHCAVVDDAWDKSDCGPLDDALFGPDPAPGCGCTADPAPSPALLALAGLLTLPRRRRVKPG
jgi:MYXO-CTERM domain-containing protein